MNVINQLNNHDNRCTDAHLESTCCNYCLSVAINAHRCMYNYDEINDDVVDAYSQENVDYMSDDLFNDDTLPNINDYNFVLFKK